MKYLAPKFVKLNNDLAPKFVKLNNLPLNDNVYRLNNLSELLNARTQKIQDLRFSKLKKHSIREKKLTLSTTLKRHQMTDNLIHPKHYIETSATIEPIDVLRYAPFDLGNALKYILRAGLKGDALTDYKKALKYLEWAKEGWGGDFKLYNEFVYRYGLLLNKFKAIENLYSAEDDNCYSYISTLIELVETKIKELETNKNNR